MKKLKFLVISLTLFWAVSINLVSAQDVQTEISDTHWSKAYEGIIPYGDVYKVCVDEVSAYSAPEYHPKYLIPAPRGLRWGTILAGGTNAGAEMVGFIQENGNKVYYPKGQLCKLGGDELNSFMCSHLRCYTMVLKR